VVGVLCHVLKYVDTISDAILNTLEGAKYHNDGQRPSIIRNPRHDPALKGRHFFFDADFVRYDLGFTLMMGAVLSVLNYAALWFHGTMSRALM
jgi:hypothetical protein